MVHDRYAQVLHLNISCNSAESHEICSGISFRKSRDIALKILSMSSAHRSHINPLKTLCNQIKSLMKLFRASWIGSLMVWHQNSRALPAKTSCDRVRGLMQLRCLESLVCFDQKSRGFHSLVSYDCIVRPVRIYREPVSTFSINHLA